MKYKFPANKLETEIIKFPAEILHREKKRQMVAIKEVRDNKRKTYLL